MKEGMSNNSTTSISQARKAVEQLKMEACMDRVKNSSTWEDFNYIRPGSFQAQLNVSGNTVMTHPKVSQAASDLLAYCEAHVREDPLIIPVPASENPFREKKFFCTIL